MSRTDTKPWYKQFWPWFVISLPATAVIAGITTVFIAFQNKPSVVREDWYKDGLAINQRLDKQERAKALGIEFAYRLDHEARRLTFTHKGVDAASTPTLSLVLLHPTLQERDMDVTVALLPDQTYAAVFDRLPQGTYNIQLTPPNGDWQLDGSISFDNSEVHGILRAD